MKKLVSTYTGTKKSAVARVLLSGLLLSGLSAPVQAVDLLGLISGWLDAFDGKMAAYKTLSKQINVSAEKLMLMNRQMFSASITSLVADRQAKVTRETVFRFKNQGILPCLQTNISTISGQLFESTDAVIIKKSNEIAETDPGDELTRYGAQMKLNSQVYCSQGQAACTSGLKSANADFSQFVAAGTKAQSRRAASYDYVDNIIPRRRPVFCKTPECEAKAADTRSLDAVDSLARLSFLAMVEGRSQQAAPSSAKP